MATAKVPGKERMDSIDRKILVVVQEDASLSVAEIGQRVGLSSTPCWKRLQRLEADGVITRRVALIDPERIGLGITVPIAEGLIGLTDVFNEGISGKGYSILLENGGVRNRIFILVCKCSIDVWLYHNQHCSRY